MQSENNILNIFFYNTSGKRVFASLLKSVYFSVKFFKNLYFLYIAHRNKQGLLYAFSFFLALSVNAQDVNYYNNLTSKNLPPVNEVLHAALKALPEYLSDLNSWSERIHLSALLPAVNFQYRTQEKTQITYERLSTTRTTETYHDSSGIQASSPISSTRRIGINQDKSPVQFDSDDKAVWYNSYNVTATWDLFKLLSVDGPTFDGNAQPGDYLRMADLNRSTASFRLRYIHKISKLYQQLLTNLRAISRNPGDENLIVKREINAGVLDQLTDFYLSKVIKN